MREQCRVVLGCIHEGRTPSNATDDGDAEKVDLEPGADVERDRGGHSGPERPRHPGHGRAVVMGALTDPNPMPNKT